MPRDGGTLRPATFLLWIHFSEEAGIVFAAHPQVKSWGPPSSLTQGRRQKLLVSHSKPERGSHEGSLKKKKSKSQHKPSLVRQLPAPVGGVPEPPHL